MAAKARFQGLPLRPSPSPLTLRFLNPYRRGKSLAWDESAGGEFGGTKVVTFGEQYRFLRTKKL